MMKKTAMVALIGAAVLALAAPVAAESETPAEVQAQVTTTTYTSADGVLSLELPGTWQEIVDPNKWFALSDGSNVITAEHYSNGEKLPEMTIADSQYVNVIQTILSTKNEVFLLTGKLMDGTKLPEVKDVLISARILKYDTKLAIAQETPSVSEFTLLPLDKTMYATTGINIRSGCTTDEAVIGGAAAGEALKVIGLVQRNGQDFGWYQITYNGGVGYVSASFVSDTAPAKEESSAPKATGKTITIYWLNSNSETLYEYSDGSYYSSEGVRYTQNNGLYYGADGTVLYPNDDELDQMMADNSEGDEANEEHMLVRNEDGKEVIVSAGGGAYYDEEGTEYSWVDEDSMMDFYGHVYTVRW